LLKLSNIYLKVLIIAFLILLILLGIESYFYMKELYFSNINISSLTNQELNQKIKYFQIQFTKFIVINIVILSIFIAILFYFIRKINKNLENEVNKILLFLTKLTKKKKEKKIESNFSKEFSKITSLLSKVSAILVKHEREYISTIAKLELSNIQKDEIISAISHEFKNPIAVINGYSETLLKNDVPPTIRKKFLEKIKKNGDKLTSLIDTLRLSIKLEENSQKIDFLSVDLYEFSQEVIDDIKDIYPNREIILEGTNHKILIDKMLFEVALTNLIENAIKYSEDKIIIKITENYISVIDKGIGIKKDEINKITEKFYRVSNNSWNNSLGLGLSIVNNIIKLHNFKLKIISEYSKGSEFRIIFS
jgi:signal transduction histidine kinase